MAAVYGIIDGAAGASMYGVTDRDYIQMCCVRRMV